MARQRSNDKAVTLSVKISEELKDSMAILAELKNLETSDYIRQVLQNNAAKNAELINKAIKLKQKYTSERNELLNIFAVDDEGEGANGND